MNQFEEFGIRKELVKAILELGFEKPTPIQEQSIPILKDGRRNFIGMAQTGTGKTAAFGLPLIGLIDTGSRIIQGLILAPTRELCVQIAKDLENYCKYLGEVKIAAVYGGASIENQISRIKRGVHIVVATPGRLTDLIRRKKIDISTVKYVVLDEADEMLNMGFQEDIDAILEFTPANKRTWLFAATMPDGIHAITSKYLSNPYEITVGAKNAAAENIEHIYYVVHEQDRYKALKRIVDANPDIFAIVFCRTRTETQEIAERLINDGYNADSLHGDLSQALRDKVMKHYRDRSLQLLVATDVAARGIDVNDVSHVINYRLPDEKEIYTHRSGRTARAGKSGVTVSIANTKDMDMIRQIEKQINTKLVYTKVPGGVEVCEAQLMALMKKIQKVEIDREEIYKYLPAIYDELKDIDKDELIKRIVSLEFNRFIEYYREEDDLNIDFLKKDHIRAKCSYQKGNSMFINLGTMDGFNTGKMANYLMEITGLSAEAFERINVKGAYSFIDIKESFMDVVLNSFDNEVYKGRKIRVDGSGGGGTKGGGTKTQRPYSPSGGKKRFFKKTSRRK
ncbi:MAG: DEAD/DEAH box helicase [Candidatus Atribacteria bacterium]|nr:DEAD/DEAH box helicase [Candidatus Atribacteria bacterium]